MEEKDHDIIKGKSSNNLKSKGKYHNQEELMELDLMQYHEKFEKQIEDRLWLFGKKVGRIKGTFIIKNPPLLKQMTIGNLTETGISHYVHTLPIFSEDKSS